MPSRSTGPRRMYIGPGSQVRGLHLGGKPYIWKEGDPEYRFVGPKRREQKAPETWETQRARKKKLNATRIKEAFRVINDQAHHYPSRHHHSRMKARNTLQELLGENDEDEPTWRTELIETDESDTETSESSLHAESDESNSDSSTDYGDIGSYIVNEYGVPIKRSPEPEGMRSARAKYWIPLSMVGYDYASTLADHGYDPSHNMYKINTLQEKAAAVAGHMVKTARGVSELPLPTKLQKKVRCWHHAFYRSLYPGNGLVGPPGCRACCNEDCKACCSSRRLFTDSGEELFGTDDMEQDDL